MSPLQNLVVDANAFIKGYALEALSSKVFTVPDVIREIRDSATKQRLKFTTYDLQLQEPSSDNIKRATDYAKKTGDYSSLSLVDIKVIALAIQIQEQFSIVSFKEASINTVFGSGETKSVEDTNLPVGFYMPKLNLGKHNAHFQNHSYVEGYTFSEKDIKLFRKLEGNTIGNEMVYLKRWANHIQALLLADSEDLEEDIGSSEGNNQAHSLETETRDSGVSGEDDDDEESDDSDGGGWITPSNYKAKKVEPQVSSPVGILSTDFAIQNVVLHTNMNLVSPDGNKITTLRSYILRCYTCFEKTTQFTKQFCPRCGNKTLRKVSVSVQEDGTMKLHFSKRFVVSTRGKKYSLPKPQGGKHAVNPILTEDQPVPQERRSKKTMARESGPFTMNDISSRSFFVKDNTTHYWDMRNPNEVKGKGRKKK